MYTTNPPGNPLSDHHRQLEEECAIPEGPRSRQAWCPFKFELRDGKQTKIGYNPRTGRRAKSNNPKTWSPFKEACQAAASNEDYDGIEYILSREDPYFLVDLDECRDPETGEITPEARRIITPFVGKAFIEISTSGRGIHVFGRGTKPGDVWCKNAQLGIELYDWGRPVVFTGNVMEDSTSELVDCQDELDRLYYECMPEHKKNPPGGGDREREEPPTEPVELPDEELLQKAATSRYGAEFQALWGGDTSSVGGDHSRADYRLMKTLLYWTGGDEERALSLFDRSGLARRKKWRRRADYRQSTVRKAKMSMTQFYRPNRGHAHGAKSAQLADVVEDLWRQWRGFDWASLLGTGTRPNSMRGHTARDVMKVMLDAAASHGTINGDEARVSLGRRTMALRAATSLRTVHKTIKHLEAEGWLRFEPPKSEDKPGTYVMRAKLHHIQDLHMGGEERDKKPCVEGGGEGLRAPCLRWSAAGWNPSKKVIHAARKHAQVPIPESRPTIKRLGKIRGAVVDVLDIAGRALSIAELYARLHPEKSPTDRRRWRPRDLRRRTLPMLIEAGIVVLEEDEVRLSENWLDRLEEARELGGEISRESLERERHRRQRAAFRRRHEVKPDRAPTAEELAVQSAELPATLEAQRCARNDRIRDAALEAFRDSSSGARKNLDLAEDGSLVNVEYIVKSVMAYHGVPLVRWDREFEHWYEPVLEAGAIVVREHAPPTPPPPEPEPPLDDHLPGCECDSCLYPAPRYARPYRGSGRRSA